MYVVHYIYGLIILNIQINSNFNKFKKLNTRTLSMPGRPSFLSGI